jgi:ATP-dependent DNA helicase RecG
MNRIDLDQLARRESEQTEWKENVADVDDVVATLSAFANDLQNLGGGYVVCGAKEESDEHGFPRLVRTGLDPRRFKEVENRVLARCRERVDPPLTPLVDEIEIESPERRILVFTQPATGVAHAFRREDQGAKHFVRVSRSTIEARNGLLRDLLVRKGALEPWDRRAPNSAGEKDIDLLALRDALRRLGVNVDAAASVEQYLSDTVAISAFVPPLCAREALTSALRPRNFALLLFAREPQRFAPGAVSFFSKYEGVSRSVRRGERLELASTLLDQLRLVLPAVEAEAQLLYDKESASPTVPKYPVRAIREAVVNAFAHRDYELADPLRITAFRDRLEIVSPGGLTLGVSPEDFTAGKAGPRWRNQALAWFLTRLGYAEAEGQGLRTIHETMQAAGCPPPEFEVGQLEVRCILRAHPRAQPSE